MVWKERSSAITWFTQKNYKFPWFRSRVFAKTLDSSCATRAGLSFDTFLSIKFLIPRIWTWAEVNEIPREQDRPVELVCFWYRQTVMSTCNLHLKSTQHLTGDYQGTIFSQGCELEEVAEAPHYLLQGTSEPETIWTHNWTSNSNEVQRKRLI